MRDLLGKIIILLYCIFSLMFVPIQPQSIVGFFMVIAVSCLVYVYEEKEVMCGIFVGIYLLLSIRFPGLCIFYPVVVFDSVRDRRWYIEVGAALILLFTIFPENKLVFLYILLGFLIAGAVAWQMVQVDHLEETLKKTRDDNTEKNLLLEEKNRNLIESQNQEIYTATLKERNRIAREIHDNVGHMLTRSILLVGAVKTINNQKNIENPLTQLEDTLHLAMNNVRESVHDLHDDSVDLQASVEEIVGAFGKCRCELDYDCGKDIPNDVKFSLIAIIKEALANVMKHSDATMVHIRLREHPGLYQLVIDDNGTNISKKEFNQREGNDSNGESVREGMGISNMRDRVNALGGNIQFEANKGFHIFITIPKKIINHS